MNEEMQKRRRSPVNGVDVAKPRRLRRAPQTFAGEERNVLPVIEREIRPPRRIGKAVSLIQLGGNQDNAPRCQLLPEQSQDVDGMSRCSNTSTAVMRSKGPSGSSLLHSSCANLGSA